MDNTKKTNGWQYDVGSVLISKAGKHYIKIDKDVVLKKGQNMTLQSYEEKLLKQVERGFIKEEDVERLLQERSFIKYAIHLPPEESKG